MSWIGVGLSGGVDSSATAALLLEQGEKVVGFTLKVWDASRCCSVDDVEDARRVARKLDIPFYVMDAYDPFDEEVIQPFVRSYGEGFTPNPCIWCNQRVKFHWLVKRARALGCDAVATGHYARLEGPPGARQLFKGADPAKDQSYFLIPDHPGGLDFVRFPLGGMSKQQVRELALAAGLPVAQKSDSQDVCFVEDGDIGRFLGERLTAKPGEIVDPTGKVLGRHQGIHAYTVGQRKGLGVSANSPLYVVRRDVATNQLVVGPRELLMASGLTAERGVWLAGEPPRSRFRCTVKIRSTAPDVPCEVVCLGDRLTVTFDEPQFGVAPGQMAVFYSGDEALGGAWINEAMQ
jgi:tRNA-specific 2-thiouridylase